MKIIMLNIVPDKITKLNLLHIIYQTSGIIRLGNNQEKSLGMFSKVQKLHRRSCTYEDRKFSCVPCFSVHLVVCSLSFLSR